MKPRRANQRTAAMTLTEVLVVVVVLAVLVVVLLPIPVNPGEHSRNFRIICVSNLKQINLAFAIWEGDHGDKCPMQTSVTNGGTMELAGGSNVWINFLVMSNELANPKILICPADTNRVAATNFIVGFNNSHISYFVGLNAVDTQPQTLLSGDDNFAIGGVPVKSGLLELLANSTIAWTTARHNRVGNIGLADGSVQTVNNSGLTKLLQQNGVATNRLAIP